MAAFRHETARLVLRDWREGDEGQADWDEQFRITNTAPVMRWLGGVMDAEKLAQQVARVETCRAANEFCFWVVERRDDGGHLAGEMLGMCGLKRADAPGSTVTGSMEVGWRFREDAWGYGYAKEAASAALHLAFTRFGAEQVVALTVDGNAPSWGLMERLGMQRRAELDYEDVRYDAALNPTIVYAITAEQWSAAQP
ncbi:GNAT family N-acetyltransferase [Erythrobacter sp. EC-HK427]|uniref:GNAT family N-acetyltransferase n=1 Tax=Erythrobacter sp. EC-HK427 TaxID=2038396 RepID=UPI001256AF50|nr:GNAT family N-acetyltransferase [Erythrobacter sp. EC-HK427]VVT03668.1 GCN5 family acetyltransferase [Erythrobacter sp. EC-HK427]